jgi:hypothetical protein
MSASEEDQERVRERRKKAVALRLAGVRPTDIAEQLGYSSVAHVTMDIKRARERSKAQLDETVEELRDLQSDRLERLLAATWSKALKGDTKAVDTAARLIERLCKLRGLEAPTQIQLTQRLELESTAVAEAVLAAIDALGLAPDARMLALNAAQSRLQLISGSAEESESA